MRLRSLLFVLLCWAVAPAWGQAPAMAPLWERTHSPEGYSLENRATAVDASGQLWVLGIRHRDIRGKDKSEDSGWVGVFGPTGELLWQQAFMLKSGDTGVREIDAFVPTSATSMAVAGLNLAGEAHLVEVDREGAVRPLRPLGRKRISFLLRSGDEFVLGGRDGRDLYAARVRRDGTARWEYTIDRGADDLFLAGVEGDGDALLLENSGIREQFFMRDAKLGLTRLGEAHNGRSPGFVFNGRGGALVKAPSGYAVLVDTGATIQQQLRFLLLGPNLNVLGEADVTTLRFALERARMGRFSAGGYLVAAADAGQLVCIRLDGEGKELTRWTSPQGRFFLHADVAGTEDLFVVATNVIESAGKVVRRSLYVSRYATRGAL
jgi:hypothetical protein